MRKFLFILIFLASIGGCVSTFGEFFSDPDGPTWSPLSIISGLVLTTCIVFIMVNNWQKNTSREEREVKEKRDRDIGRG